MKSHIIFISVCLFFATLTLYSFSQRQSAKEDVSEPCFRATEGDTMSVLLNHIKADKREQFERFVHEILFPVALKSSPIDQQAGMNTRVLHPISMNEDSTYTYVFIMDPIIQDANYQFSYYLKKGYGEEKVQEYLKMLQECYASPQTGYRVVQSQH